MVSFENKRAEFKKCYGSTIRYIRRHWRKNPVAWMGGYIGPAASNWSTEAAYYCPTTFRMFAAIGFDVWEKSTHIDLERGRL
jgi:hypothetical protein